MKKFQKNNVIETIAFLYIKDKKLLLVRSKGKKAFYMPGGKRERREIHQETLLREIKEELQIKLNPSSVTFFGRFEAQAYGKEKGVLVRIYCYQSRYVGELKKGAEIEELDFFSHSEYLRQTETAPAVRLIFDDLKKKKLVK
ncbi:NUDIX domain-containing protein [Candidatus Roizmanbacteria bacterium]|nr:NUDIX domain-containing protein [Candidatus Roizmanbacteria bacterium]